MAGTLFNISLALIPLTLCFPIQAQVSFFQPPTYAGTGNVFVADFNGDGKPDLLTSDGTMNLGNGDGTFKPGQFVPGANANQPVMAVADFNGDGKPDVLELGTGSLLVLLGNGDGTFQAPINSPSGANLSTAAAADLNGDGKADVVGLANNSLYVYIGKGDGTFAAGVPYSLRTTLNGRPVLSFGGFTGSGNTDVVVSTTGGQEFVFLGNGDGTFQPAKLSSGVANSGGSEYAAAGDFNGDGKLDLAISGSIGVPNGTVSILLGNGDGTFQAPVTALPGSGPLAAADLDSNGTVDLVLESDFRIAQVYLGNGNATFSNANNYVLTFNQTADQIGIAIADFNGDKKPDIATGDAVLLGNGDGTFQGIQVGSGGPAVSGLAAIFDASLVVGDFDKDGVNDVAAVSESNVYIFKNDGTGKLSLTHTYPLQEPSFGIVTADFNKDDNLDLLVVGTSQGLQWGYSVLLGNGDGSFQTPVFYPQSVQTQAGAYSAVVADFKNNGSHDVATALASSGVGAPVQNLAVLLGNGDGTFATPAYLFDAGADDLVTADYNGDGKADIAAGLINPSSTGILLGNGDGTFQPALFPANLNNFGVQFTADLRNNGKFDLISSNQVALGNGDGTFNPLTPFTQVQNQVVAVADFNGDGKPDVLVVNYGSQSGIMLGNGDGTFGPLINIPASGALPLTIVVADMNGDGRPDLVFPWGQSASGVAVMLNTTPAGFQLSASPLSPSPVIAGNSATSTVTVAPTFGFNGTVRFRVQDCPAEQIAALVLLRSPTVRERRC